LGKKFSFPAALGRFKSQEARASLFSQMRKNIVKSVFFLAPLCLGADCVHIKWLEFLICLTNEQHLEGEEIFF
jgi:hypothetical protein